MSIVQSIRAQIAPIHPLGYPFIGGFAFVSLRIIASNSASTSLHPASRAASMKRLP